MLEHEKEVPDELLLRELLQAMDREIAEFRRLKDGNFDGGASSAEQKESLAHDLVSLPDPPGS